MKYEKQRIDSAALHRISCSRVGSLSSVALFRCIFSFGTFFGFIRVYTVVFSDPCIRLYGKLYCELSLCSNNPNLSYGDLVFYPYQHDIIEKGFCIIPFSTSIRNNDGNLFAMDTVPLYLGNVCDYQDIQIGLFSESNYLDKSLTLKNINLFFAQAQSGESRSTALIVENSV